MGKIEKLRNEIDIIDDELTSLLEKRLKIGKQIIDFKKSKNLPIEDLDRESKIISNLNEKHKVPKSLLEDIYSKIFNYLKDS